jgi:hypothetical protein
VGDDNARQVGLDQPMRATLGQRAPDGEAHVLAVDLRHLLDRECDAVGRFDAAQQFRDADLAGGVADVVAGRGAAGDGAAGAQNDHAALACSKGIAHGLPNFRKLVKNTGTGYSASAARSRQCSSPSSLPPASNRFWT